MTSLTSYEMRAIDQKGKPMKYLVLRKRLAPPTIRSSGWLRRAVGVPSSSSPSGSNPKNCWIARPVTCGAIRTLTRSSHPCRFRSLPRFQGRRDEAAWGLDAVGASSSGQDGDGVTVAVLDTGIDKAHPAFAGLPFADEDLVDFIADEAGKPGSAEDDHGHGTHVAGTIFGRTVGGIRIGIAPGIRKVLIGKVLGLQGGSTEAVFNAIEWRWTAADVISMSLGCNFPGFVKRLVDELRLPTEIAAHAAAGIPGEHTPV